MTRGGWDVRQAYAALFRAGDQFAREKPRPRRAIRQKAVSCGSAREVRRTNLSASAEATADILKVDNIQRPATRVLSASQA
jgi:hypothetical protein